MGVDVLVERRQSAVRKVLVAGDAVEEKVFGEAEDAVEGDNDGSLSLHELLFLLVGVVDFGFFV